MAKKNKSVQVDDIIVRLKKRNKPKKAKGGTYRDYAESVRGKATVNQRQPTKAEIEEALEVGKKAESADIKAAEARAEKDGRDVEGRDPDGNFYLSANERKRREYKRSPESQAVHPSFTPLDLLGGGASVAGILGLGGKAALKAAAKGSLKEVASKARKEAVGRAGKLSEKLSKTKVSPRKKTPAELREAKTRFMNQRSEQLRPDSFVKVKEKGGKSEVVSYSVPRNKDLMPTSAKAKAKASAAEAARDYKKYNRMQDEIIDLIHGTGPVGSKWKNMSTAGRKQLFDDIIGMSYESYMKKYATSGAPRQPKDLLRNLDDFYKAAID